MITVKLWQIIASFIIAQLVHVGFFFAAAGGHEPKVLIEGSSISVQLDTGGAAMAASSAGESRAKKKALQAAVTEMEQPKEAARPQDEPSAEAKLEPKLEAAPREEQVSSEEEVSLDKLVKATPQIETASSPSPEKLQPKKSMEEAATSRPKQQITEAPLTKPVPIKSKKDIAEEIVDDSDTNSDAKDDENKTAGAASSAASSIAGTKSTTQTQNSASPGNAISSNYAGKVMRHLSKFRRPRASSSGSALITFSFTVTGEIRTIDIASSSGSYKFDQDAIKFIRYAAPFPPPPEEGVRTFTVEIEGR